MVFEKGNQFGKLNKGYKHTEEARKKMSLARKGKLKSEEHKRKIAEANKGKICSEETRKKISEKQKERLINGVPKEQREKHSEWMKERFVGKNNFNWKGDKVSYKGLHQWVRKHLFKPDFCKCNLKLPVEVHNIDGKYTRNLETWEWLCKKCHGGTRRKYKNGGN